LYFPVDTACYDAVKWRSTTTRELGETGLRGWLPCHRPDEPELGNTSAGRRTVWDAEPLESFQRLFYLVPIIIKKE
jgi:hypothetical protein